MPGAPWRKALGLLVPKDSVVRFTSFALRRAFKGREHGGRVFGGSLLWHTARTLLLLACARAPGAVVLQPARPF